MLHRLVFLGHILFPGNSQVPKSKIQRVILEAASEVSLLVGKHAGPYDDTEPDGAIVYNTTHNGTACVNTNGVAAAADAVNAAGADDGINGEDTTNDANTLAATTVAEIQRSENAAAGSEISALCTSWNSIIHGESRLAVRDRQLCSLKQ